MKEEPNLIVSGAFTTDLTILFKKCGIEPEVFKPLMHFNIQAGDVLSVDTGLKKIIMMVQGKTWGVHTDNRALTCQLHFKLVEVIDSSSVTH